MQNLHFFKGQREVQHFLFTENKIKLFGKLQLYTKRYFHRKKILI